MIVFPQAKINIGLRITGVRPNGYHDLETLFLRIPLADALEVIPAEEDSFDDGGFGDPQANLVYRAMELLRHEVGSLPPLQVILRKRIPTGAGLGGGSSDASAMLLLLRRMLDLPLSDERLAELALQLGADCPFFLTEGPQIGRGLGEELTPFDLDLSGRVLTLALPGIHVSTAEAYGRIAISSPAEPLEQSLRRPMTEWREWVINDFESTVFALHPELAEIKEQLYAAGAVYASMSGSGSALYALSEAPLDLTNVTFPILSYRL
jgi:4-diphosphocytidyl-2-C-methyl-D-erythritol kinase